MEAATPARLLECVTPGTLPPALFFQGGEDPRLPPDTADRTAALWREAGGDARAIVYPGMAHAVGSWEESALLDMLAKVRETTARL